MLPGRTIAIALITACMGASVPIAQGASAEAAGSGTTQKVAFASPLPGARLTSTFGLRKHPILGATMMHEGLDLAAPAGTPIRAAASGIVAEVGYDAGYGNFVRLRHGDRLETFYGHMSSRAAEKGQPVAAGAVIGYVGSTGLSNGPHLHFEVRRDGVAVDPVAPGRLIGPPAAPGRSRLVEVVRGGRSAEASGGPAVPRTGGIQVIRGGRR